MIAMQFIKRSKGMEQHMDVIHLTIKKLGEFPASRSNTTYHGCCNLVVAEIEFMTVTS